MKRGILRNLNNTLTNSGPMFSTVLLRSNAINAIHQTLFIFLKICGTVCLSNSFLSGFRGIITSNIWRRVYNRCTKINIQLSIQMYVVTSSWTKSDAEIISIWFLRKYISISITRWNAVIKLIFVSEWHLSLSWRVNCKYLLQYSSTILKGHCS